MPETLLRETPNGVVVSVWVVPGASSTGIVGRYGRSVKVRVAAPPEGGRANRMVAATIAAALGADRARVVSGLGSRRKEVLVSDVSLRAARRGFTALGVRLEGEAS